MREGFIPLGFKHLRQDTRRVSKAALLGFRGFHRRVIVIRPNLMACPNFLKVSRLRDFRSKPRPFHEERGRSPFSLDDLSCVVKGSGQVECFILLRVVPLSPDINVKWLVIRIEV